ncbi:MAG: TRAP transporter large permease [Gammaproteobacteria bacterium]
MLFALGLSFIFLLLIGTPIAFSLGISGVIGFLVYDPGLLHLIPQRMYAGVDTFPLMAVPFFILAGELMGTSGILARLVRFADTLVGHIRGGLAHVNILASMIFAGISGSAIADASALGSTLIPAMEKAGYSRRFASAVTAASAVIGPIIPPSIPMIIYAFVVGQVSIGGLFLAGVIPGLLMGLGMMAIVYVIARKRGYATTRRRASLREIAKAFVEAIWALLMPVIILGGILGGIFTATEAAAVAVAYAIFVGSVITRDLRWRHVAHALSRCVTVSAVVFLVVATSSIVSWLLTANLLPVTLASTLRGITSDPAVFLFLAIVFLILIGCVLDNIAAMIMIAPILTPTAEQYGIDPLHFGMVFVLSSVIGMLTPPVGAVLFTVCGVAKVPMEEVVKESLPLLVWLFVVLLAITYMAPLALALPHLFGYGR